MMKSIFLKNILVVIFIVITVVACKKKPDAVPVEETPPPCFNSNNNGNYKGSGSTLSSPFTSGTITITRTSCDVVNYNLTTNTAGQIINQASQLVLNSGGGYDGKQNNGDAISLSFGSVLTINAIGSFSFTGTKQP